MDGEKENALLAHSKLSHKTLPGHDLSTIHRAERGFCLPFCFIFFLPSKQKKKKKKKHRTKIKLE
jgi:hypothetical protein